MTVISGRPAIVAFAEELGGEVAPMGINWTWVDYFPSRKAAESFIEALEADNWEHRGIYQVEDCISVRFR